MEKNLKLIYKNPKKFFSLWKDGIKNITPAQQLHSKIVGQIGNMIGLCIAWVFLFLRGFWFFSFSMVFILFILFIDTIGLWQQWQAVCKLQDEFKDLESLKEVLNRGI